MTAHTSHAELTALFQAQRAAFAAAPDPSLEERRARLVALREVCSYVAPRVADALRADFGSHDPSVGALWELGGVLSRLGHTSEHLAAWMRPSERDPGAYATGVRSYVRLQPRGVVGNMAPWNFPIDLTLGPLVDILAAGNHAIVKPSELAPACTELVRDAIGKCFDPRVVAVVVGDVDLAQAFTELPWDHLFYTGNPGVARKVMAAAAKHLTPVTLELGGKCPAIVAPDRVNDDTLAEILSVKAIKSGQVCINTDYMFVPETDMSLVIDRLRTLWSRMFPTFVHSDASTGIINERHYDRLLGYVEEARASGTQVIVLGDEKPDRARRKLPLTLIINPGDDLLVMQEEIFGPILPIKSYAKVDDAVAYVNAHPHPLALYVFTDDSALAERVITQTASGGVCVNAVALHAALPSLPFGGIGNSGMGAHHGYEGFQTFSHSRAVVWRGQANPWEFMRPPYGELVQSVAKFITGA
jgi:coniferyl-aldehyde dehydrogenase